MNTNCHNEIDCLLIAMANTVKAEKLFEINVVINLSDAVKIMFVKEKQRREKICHNLYKSFI